MAPPIVAHWLCNTITSILGALSCITDPVFCYYNATSSDHLSPVHVTTDLGTVEVEPLPPIFGWLILAPMYALLIQAAWILYLDHPPGQFIWEAPHRGEDYLFIPRVFFAAACAWAWFYELVDLVPFLAFQQQPIFSYDDILVLFERPVQAFTRYPCNESLLEGCKCC